jgi:hypothetical protein
MIQGGSGFSEGPILKPRSSPGSCCMKTTKWSFIITSLFKCGLPVLKVFLRPVFNFNLKLVEVKLSWRHHESWRWRYQQKYFWDRKVNRREVTLKYGHLVVFIYNDSAKIWGFRYGFTLTYNWYSKITASTVVFVRVVRALKHTISSFPCSPGTTLTYSKIERPSATKRWSQKEIFTREAAD